MTWVRLDTSFCWSPRVADLTDRQFRVFVDAVCYLADHYGRQVDRRVVQKVTGAKKREMDLFLSLGLLLMDDDGNLSATEEIVASEPPARKFEHEGGWTYFIQACDGGPIKIGSTRWAPEARLAALQTSHSKDLRIIALMKGAHNEKRLHAQFADWRVRGEWFDENAPGLLELVAEAIV